MGIRSALAIATAATAACIALATPAAPEVPHCDGAPNTIPVHTAAPTFVRSVPNGKLYRGGAGDDTFNVMHLWGTPYEQGFAQGQMIKADFAKLESTFYAFFKAMLATPGTGLPAWMEEYAKKFGVPALLSLSADWTRPFTPVKYIQEMQGMADGANVTLDDIYRLNMFPEITKAACTVVGANGPSTPTTQLNQLRALDISTETPIKDWPQVTVYHNADGTHVANFGWSALIGTLTGFSSTSMGVGEKVWLRHAEGIDGTKGEPWMFILRDVLSMKTFDEALNHMKNAKRTCAIHVGLGNGNENKFRGITMAQKAWKVYNDTTMNYPAHPALKGLVYWDKHEQPSHFQCLGNLLKGKYGKLDAKTLALYVAPMSTTGNFHTAAIDYAGQKVYFANSRKTTVTTGDMNAYARQFTLLDAAALFQETW